MSKGLEALNELYNSMPFAFEESRTKMRCLETLEKELKALEIIRNKPQHELAQIQWRKANTYEEYENMVYRWDSEYWDMIYTKEEFDLLKEVLL